jgi:hypothetical protein
MREKIEQSIIEWVNEQRAEGNYIRTHFYNTNLLVTLDGEFNFSSLIDKIEKSLL